MTDPVQPFVVTLEGCFGISQCSLCEQGKPEGGDIVHLPWCRYVASMVLRFRGIEVEHDAFLEDRRSASLDDEPHAPLWRRLLLALAIHPDLVNEVGHEVLVGAAATIRARSHRMDFIAQDWAMERGFREDLLAAVRRIDVLLADMPRNTSQREANVWQRWDDARRVAQQAIAGVDEFEGA